MNHGRLDRARIGVNRARGDVQMIRRVLLLLCVLLAPVAHAVDYEVVPWSVQSASKSASGAATRITYAARPKAAGMPTLYRTSSVMLPPASAGSLVRWAMRRSPYAIWAVAFYEYAKSNGYMFIPDAPHGDLTGGEQTGECAAETVWWISQYGYDAGTSTDLAGLIASYRSGLYAQSGGALEVLRVWVSGARIYARFKNGGSEFTSQIGDRRSGPCGPSGASEEWVLAESSNPPESWAPFLPPSTVVGEPAPLPVEDYWDNFVEWPGSDSSAMQDAFTDPVSSRPYSTPEIDSEAERIRDQLIQESGEDPATYPDQSPAPPVDPSDASSPGLSEDPIVSTPEQPGGGSAQQPVELPAFCEYAQTLCDWLGWTQEPLEPLTDAPDLPVVESAPGTWDSGLGSGSCPAPIVVAALGASVSLSWQPACDFVSILRPILIAFAGIAAALILLGQRAGGAG